MFDLDRNVSVMMDGEPAPSWSEAAVVAFQTFHYKLWTD